MGGVSAAKTCEVEGGAAAVIGVDRKRPTKCRSRGRIIAEHLADFAQRKPGRRECRRGLGCLGEQIGCGGKIPPRRQVAAKPVAPVGDQVAR